ncbi:TetR/AcrR family transcriptional regulator [Herbiconiux sp. SYSU D00978]|uniref:TetR/AcrR family transcriptional regulator n=1 Tax=Herbiconiux sp. SYSU D00978 TaxID=2812562 RepID=UPI001A974461|nr:TetR/AcrR family transcriptional regulator [Herbiconiux sp. SYSU D00978]
MSSARDRILDAYERQILAGGERGTTLDAVAADAGVSKGGLLYHFSSKDSLRSSLLERLVERSQIDAAEMPQLPEDAVRLFVESSADTADQLHSTFLASQTLARNGHADAAEAIRTVEQGWYDRLAEATGDPLVARMAQLIGDGIYDNAAIDPGGDGFTLTPSAEEREAITEALISLLDR